ncbi:hybrid sensor histidine kinase/response regulator [Roseateles sp.]|uniref:ATP-binding response regulator n=1 Tax=Roseateles sp. TaxID=1971397 RepID=UPI002869FBDE|nr:hybrid sensor histidine kinase/response regulator [Roseateles sp.]
MCVAMHAFSLWSRRLGGVLLVLALQQAHADAPPTVTELRQAERESGGGRSRVQLPDSLQAPSNATPPLRALYRLKLNLANPPQRLALLVPGLRAHARIHFNGHLLDDSQADPLAPLPRSLARIRLIDIPVEFVRQGDNLLEVDAAGRTLISLSPISIGPRAALLPGYNMRVLAVVIGPAFVAAVIASLALCVLLLWARRHDALYGYFGLGAMGMALHNAWSVLPSPPLPELHNTVWWTVLYTFFVAMLVTFCLRFAGWRWRRFEQLLAALPLAAAPLLYAAEAGDALAQAHGVWLLGLVGVAAVGLAAVARYAWTQRNVDGALLLLTAGLSVAFGARDRAVHQLGEDNNPVYLMPYAGLLFAMLIAWMLIDRFVAASRALELLNRDLEQRVSAKSAELVGAVEAMRTAKEAAEQANRAKTSFLAAASHDLRQPVHALGLYMAALVDEDLNPAQLELVQRMKASLGSLDTLFNALLDISRMDAGAVTPRLRAFAPAPLLHRLAEEFAAPAAERGLRLSVRMAPAPTGLHAFSDPVLVEQIVRNLLGNAVKYTRSGGVLLSCRVRGAAPSRCWRIEVWDSGPGIALADQERVFEEFYQVGNPERDRLAGLGLGLSIVRRLAQLLGHRLALFSRPGRGSRFALELPCTTEPLPQRISDGRQDELAGRVVAVIDDDPDVRQAMQLLLERWDCRVLAGADADEVIRQLHGISSALQAIVADYRLRGGHTGIEAINMLRAACSDAVPALLVSGESSPEQLAQMKASGFACMSKPVRPARLRSWLVGAAGPTPEESR